MWGYGGCSTEYLRDRSECIKRLEDGGMQHRCMCDAGGGGDRL